MPWTDWIRDRIQRLFSTEFLLSAIALWTYYSLAQAGKLTLEYTGAAGTILGYLWARTRQKQNGGG